MDNTGNKNGKDAIDSSKWITIESAQNLVKSGEWVFFGKLHEDIRKLVKERLEKVYENTPESAQIDYAARMIVSVIEETAEDEKNYAIPNIHDPLDPKMMARLGYGRVLKVMPTLNKLKLEVIGFIGIVLAVSDWNKLAIIATACSAAPPFVNSVKALLSAWERLEDNEEIIVFETVSLLQNSLVISNFDAYDDGDMDNAFEYLTPTLDEIGDFILDNYPERQLIPEPWLKEANSEFKKQLLKVLNNLSERGILRERNLQWSIVF
jgi:hypothetical protein